MNLLNITNPFKWGYRVPLEKEFLKKTDLIAALLLEIKKHLDEYDKKNSDKKKRAEMVSRTGHQIFGTLDGYFEDVFRIVRSLSPAEYHDYQRYFQKKLLYITCTQPLNKRIYEKPLGYPGDFIMMNYYHEDGYRGETSFEMLMHRYTLETPLARVVINRSKYITLLIEKMAKENKEFKALTSIGCGPAKELIDLLNDNNSILGGISINCLDSEADALEQIKRAVAESKNSKKKRFNFNYLNMNVLKLIKISKNGIIAEQDFIYSLGLFDYLNDKLASKLIEVLYNNLKKGGTLLISNFHKNIKLRAYLELLGEWYLILRDEEDMKRLACKIKDAKSVVIEPEKETGQSVYLIIKK